MPSRQKFGKGLRFCIVINELVCTFEDVKNIIHPLLSPTAYQHSGTRSGQCVRMRLCLPALRLPGGILSGLQVMGSAASSATRWTPLQFCTPWKKWKSSSSGTVRGVTQLQPPLKSDSLKL